MTAKFAIEPFARALPEMQPLFERHWREIATYPDVPLNPDYEFYHAAAAAGLLVVYTARLDGRLVGYAVFIVRKGHLHYRDHGWALNDIIWVDPTVRGQRLGDGLMDFAEGSLRDAGFSFVHMRTKIKHPHLARLLEERGYALIEYGHEKRL